MIERRDDLEASLADIDRKLRDLQAELQVVAGREEAAPPLGMPDLPTPEPAAPPAPPPPPPPPAREPPPAAAPTEAARLVDDAADRVAELARRIEELRELGAELEAATHALQQQVARGQIPPAATWSGEVVVRAGPFRDIASLGEFERALATIPGAQDAFVRSFAGDRALVELRLAQETDLVAEMSQALSTEVRVVDSGPGELEIALGP